MKHILFSLLLLGALASCQPKQEPVENYAVTPDVPLKEEVVADAAPISPTDSVSKASVEVKEDVVDTTFVDNDDFECYEWTNTYLATTAVEDEEGDEFELYIAISLSNYEKNDYTGTIHMYLSGCEEQMFKGTVTAKAQHNYVTVYFDENVDGMDDMFKHGDKLVKFEISYGEYVASWFAAMNEYVDEYTILSLQK